MGSSPWEPWRGLLGQELSEGCCEHLQPTDGAAGNCHECGDRESQVPPPISPPYLSYLYSSVLLSSSFLALMQIILFYFLFAFSAVIRIAFL